MLKRKKLRHNEYYDMQYRFDSLYAQSVNGQKFYDLMDIITSQENIRLAYRNIKRNTGSQTAGTDQLTIKDIQHLSVEDVIDKVRSMYRDYHPQSARRVFIPKPNGKERPLGIPTIWDRIFQQCLFTLSNLSVDSSKTFFVLCQICMGLGMGTSMMALNTHVLQSAPIALVNRVTPLTSATQQVMMSFASAVMASFLTSRTEAHADALKIPGKILGAIRSGNITPNALPYVKQVQEATVSAFSNTFLLAAGIAEIGWLLAWTLRRPKKEPAIGDENKEANDSMMMGH